MKTDNHNAPSSKLLEQCLEVLLNWAIREVVYIVVATDITSGGFMSLLIIQKSIEERERKHKK